MKLKSQRLHLIKECRGNAWWENFSNNRRGSDALLKGNSNAGACKLDVSLLPKEHHQNYWKFTINSIQICFKTDTVLIQIHASSVSTCLCAVEFYLQMSQPNSFNEKDLMVLFNCRWSRRSVNKLSLIRDLYLFTSEARISKWSK